MSAGNASENDPESRRDGILAHTYTSIVYHLVFSTKDRAFAIAVSPKLWAYIAGVSKNLHCHAYAICGTANHVHALVGVPPILSAAEAVQKLKANSSRWLREHRKWPGWQECYGAFSVSGSNIDAVRHYRTRKNIIASNRSKMSSFRSCNDPGHRSTGTRCSTKCRPFGTLLLIPIQPRHYQLAKALHLPGVYEIVRGQRSISADVALRLGKYFGMTPQFWMNLQADYDLRVGAMNALLKKIQPRVAA